MEPKARAWLESGYRTADKSRISLSYRRILYIHYYAGEDYKGVMVWWSVPFFASAIIRSFFFVGPFHFGFVFNFFVFVSCCRGEA